MDAYFETSALIKLLIPGSGSGVAARLWDEAERIATSRLTFAEARAALAAAHRDRRITGGAHRLAKKALETTYAVADIVGIDDALVSLAGDLAEKHALRGFDAVHLSSLVSRGPRVLLVTWDRDLSRAGRNEGLSVTGLK